MKTRILFLLLLSSMFINQVEAQRLDLTPQDSALIAVADSNGNVVKVGDKAPDFEIALINGEKVKLSDLRGKVVMLQFTASWCTVCRKEMPHIESEIWQVHKNDSDFVLIGVDRDEPIDKVKRFQESTGVTYPLGLDPRGDIFAKYALRNVGITRNVLIGRDGVILKITRLYDPDEFGSLVDLINKQFIEN